MSNMALKLAAGKQAAIAALNDQHGRGGAAKLAVHLGLTQSAVSQWEAVPLVHVRAVSDLTGVASATIRPDHYDDAAPAPKRRKAA